MFDEHCSQADVFEQLEIEKNVRMLFEGYNQTILVYGHTGSGKTYTLEG